MAIVKTKYTDWRCVPQLAQVASNLETIDPELYEIRNCDRQEMLPIMVRRMKKALQDSLDLLEQIDTSKKYETQE